MKKSITHSTSFFIDIVAFITPNAAQSSYHILLMRLNMFNVSCLMKLKEV